MLNGKIVPENLLFTIARAGRFQDSPGPSGQDAAGGGEGELRAPAGFIGAMREPMLGVAKAELNGVSLRRLLQGTIRIGKKPFFEVLSGSINAKKPDWRWQSRIHKAN